MDILEWLKKSDDVSRQMIREAEEGIARLRTERKERERAFSELMSYQSSGMSAEKSGDLLGAAGWYERSISFGESSPLMRINDYLHSCERLAIVYRKLKRFDDEVRVIRLALAHRNDGRVYDAPFARLEVRLGRALALREKNKKV